MVDAARREFSVQCGLPAEEFYADAFTSEADRPRPLAEPGLAWPAGCKGRIGQAGAGPSDSAPILPAGIVGGGRPPE